MHPPVTRNTVFLHAVLISREVWQTTHLAQHIAALLSAS